MRKISSSLKILGIATTVGIIFLFLSSNRSPFKQQDDLDQFDQKNPNRNIANKKNQNKEITKDVVIVENLEVPWEMVFLSDKNLLITERTGKLILVEEGVKSEITIPNVRAVGEGGLLGLALDPNFSNNKYIYLYLTTEGNNGPVNKVNRYTFSEKSLNNKLNILDNIPAGTIHNGGRIKFGPDNYLYITTGDAGIPDLAQDLNSLAGKILRIEKDGSIPPGNPFSNEIYTYGHRNPQGLTWDSKGNLWATEHGPTANDEINVIYSGQNYGWPEITGEETANNMETPTLTSGSNFTWAPAGITYLNGRIYFGGLRSQTLFSINPEEEPLNTTSKIENIYGRIRIVTKDQNDNLYIGTSNLDGRGNPEGDDDKIVKISL